MSYTTTTVTASSSVTVTRECEFCAQTYLTPEIKIERQGSQDSYAADSKAGVAIARMFSKLDRTAEKRANKNLEFALHHEKKWLLEGKGKSRVGVLCPQCFKFSSACTTQFFSKW